MNELVEKQVRIGTSGWSYPRGEEIWNGIFYPAKVRNELEFYSKVFNTVEVNSTFYRLIDPRTARDWVKMTPKDFEFSIKVWQKFTHPGMFRRATGDELECPPQRRSVRSSSRPFLRSRKPSKRFGPLTRETTNKAFSSQKIPPLYEGVRRGIGETILPPHAPPYKGGKRSGWKKRAGVLPPLLDLTQLGRLPR
jgi:hypothetical protein